MDSLKRIAAVVGAGRSLVGSRFVGARHLGPRKAIESGDGVDGFMINFGVGRKTHFNWVPTVATKYSVDTNDLPIEINLILVETQTGSIGSPHSSEFSMQLRLRMHRSKLG